MVSSIDRGKAIWGKQTGKHANKQTNLPISKFVRALVESGNLEQDI